MKLKANGDHNLQAEHLFFFPESHETSDKGFIKGHKSQNFTKDFYTTKSLLTTRDAPSWSLKAMQI